MIKLYYMKIEGDCSDEQSLALYHVLPEKRKESVDRARNQDVAKKRLYTGAFLQCVLAKETGVSLEDLHYEYNEWEKPFLVDSDLHFNMTHSGDYVVLAVSDAPIGVDIEHKTRNYEAIAKRCFHPLEYEDIMSLGEEEEQKMRFLEYWTMKEAYVKLVGTGMSIPFSSFLVERNSGAETVIVGKAVYGHTFSFDSYRVSVCSSLQDDVRRLVPLENETTICRMTVCDVAILCQK